MKFQKKNILSFDIESTSLHGRAFAVGAIVIDVETGEELDNFLLKSEESEQQASQWVKENVIPHLKDVPYVATDKELRDQFWEFYSKHKESCTVWADVAYPVETNFLEAVYGDDPENREFGMPYPLYDVSSHLDSNVDRSEFCEIEGLSKHNPYHDAKASGYSLIKCLKLIFT